MATRDARAELGGEAGPASGDVHGFEDWFTDLKRALGHDHVPENFARHVVEMFVGDAMPRAFTPAQRQRAIRAMAYYITAPQSPVPNTWAPGPAGWGGRA